MIVVDTGEVAEDRHCGKSTGDRYRRRKSPVDLTAGCLAWGIPCYRPHDARWLSRGASPSTVWRSSSIPPWGLVLQSSVRCKVKTIVLFLEAGHTLERGDRRHFRIDTDDPILGQGDQHFFAQRAWRFFALLGIASTQMLAEIRKIWP